MLLPNRTPNTIQSTITTQAWVAPSRLGHSPPKKTQTNTETRSTATSCAVGCCPNRPARGKFRGTNVPMHRCLRNHCSRPNNNPKERTEPPCSSLRTERLHGVTLQPSRRAPFLKQEGGRTQLLHSTQCYVKRAPGTRRFGWSAHGQVKPGCSTRNEAA